MIRIGVIGCGYWGPNLIRNFVSLSECELVAIADTDPTRLARFARLYPMAQALPSADQLITSEKVDAVAVATPIHTHHALAKAALQHGKHVLVEKPMCATVAEGEELIQVARDAKRVLMVDHTFIFAGAVRKIRQLIDAQDLGEIFYLDSVRVNLGLFQHDMSVLWDLAPHDFSIMTHLLDKKPTQVSAIGARPIRRGTWNLPSLAYATVRFADETIAHFHVNWLSPVKVRRMLIGGSRRMVVYDHLDPDNQVKVYDRGIEVQTPEDRHHMLVQYRTGEMMAPKIDQREALEVACRHFLECATTGRAPLTNGEAGLAVVRLLQASQESIDHDGAPVKV